MNFAMSGDYPFPIGKAILLLGLFFLLINPAISQDKVEKPYRDYFGKLGLTIADEENLKFLDRLTVTSEPTNSEYARIVELWRVSDSLDVVCHALGIVSNFPTMPDFVISELVSLARSNDDTIKNHLALVLGKLAIPKTFPVIYGLSRNPHTAGNAIAVFYRFGIESLAGLPIFFRQSKGGTSKIPWIENFVARIPQHILAVSCNGASVIIPYVPQEISSDLFNELEFKPILYQIKAFLEKHKSAKTNFLKVPEKQEYKNFFLPEGIRDVKCKKLEFNNTPLSAVIEGLFNLLEVRVIFQDKIDGFFSFSAKNRFVGQVIDEIFSRFGLEGSLQGGRVVVRKKQP